jgi:hypothetical protein
MGEHRRRWGHRVAPDEPALVPLRGNAGAKRAEHRAPERRIAAGPLIRYDDLDLRAARAASTSAPSTSDEHRLDRDLGVPEWRADDSRLDRRS